MKKSIQSSMGVLVAWMYNTLGILRLALRGVANRRRLEVPTGEREYDTRMSSTQRSRHDCTPQGQQSGA